MKKLLLVVGVGFIAGCAPMEAPYPGAPMLPFDDYETLATLSALAEQCSNKGVVDRKLAVDVNDAIKGYIGLYSVVPAIFDDLRTEYGAAAQKVLTVDTCKESEFALVEFVTISKNEQKQALLKQAQ